MVYWLTAMIEAAKIPAVRLNQVFVTKYISGMQAMPISTKGRRIATSEVPKIFDQNHINVCTPAGWPSIITPPRIKSMKLSNCKRPIALSSSWVNGQSKKPTSLSTAPIVVITMSAMACVRLCLVLSSSMFEFCANLRQIFARKTLL